jgi:hypothetical protein
MINWQDPVFVWTAVGTAASVVGLAISIVLIFITSGARKAAEEAKAATETAARKRGLVEELENINHKADQLGVLLQHEQWFAVQMRVQEVLAICSQILSRWPDGLSEEKRNDLLSASQLVRSIASRLASKEFSPAERKKLVDTQLKVSTRISFALGEAKNAMERTPKIQ